MEKTVTIEKNAGNIYVGDSPEFQINTAINELLNELANKGYEFKRLNRKPTPETITKIKHNNLIAKKHIIQQYLNHSSKIETALKDIDSSTPFGKDKILENLNGLYYEALDQLQIEYFTEEIDMSRIRENSDYILDYIIQKLRNTSIESANKPQFKESIELGVNVVVAYAFIECIVMENPNI
ncbi:MAG: hypothetical protein ACI8RP_000206 [Urechidicola sp.]|jgi:hypothetical protein